MVGGAEQEARRHQACDENPTGSRLT